MSIRKGLAYGAIGLAVLAAGLYALGFAWVRGTLPQTEGSIRLAGLTAPVNIIRDANGVPHIFAAREVDTYFALGFIHASDRFWQMDIMRRLGAGRLSEIFGEPALETDRLMRTLGIHRLAGEALEALPPPTRAALETYAAGVNAWIERSGQNLPPEFAVLRYQPEPWQPADSTVWGKLMAWQLAGNMRQELLRARLNGILPPEAVAQLLPSGIGRRASDTDVSRAEPGGYAGPAAERLAAALGPGPTQRWASNVWALAPPRTATGGAILANDPHLGLSAPIPWYLVRVESPMLSLRGATVPGVPFLILGQNKEIAWGVTNTGADVQDLLLFGTEPGDDSVLTTPEGSVALTVREEEIAVRGGEPVTVRVRTSPLGPVISDLGERFDEAREDDEALVLVFTALAGRDMTPAALYALNHAKEWADVDAALESWTAPPVNIAFADSEGQIGFAVAGDIPVRGPGEGLAPKPASLRHDRLGEIISAGDLPRLFQPREQWIANANEDPAPPGYGFVLADSFEEDARKRRLVELIEATDKHRISGSLAIQTDTVSPVAHDLVPLMMGTKPESPREAALFADLLAWDGAMDRDRREPLIFAHWIRELTRAVFEDDLGEVMDGYMTPRPTVLKSVLTDWQGWCDDTTTDALETCDDMLRLSLRRALLRLEEAHGPNPDAWRWGSEHVAALAHPLFSRVPMLGWLGDASRATDGGEFTLNRGGSPVWDEERPFAHTHGAGYRGVYDLANIGNSRFVIATGQSGNPFSPHYASLVDLWRDGKAVKLAGSPEELTGRGYPVLTLRPDPD